MADDTDAIQKAIFSLGGAGGMVKIPRGTYLLDSYHRSPHPWFNYNIRVPSHVFLLGEPGARLLQGPNGRALKPSGATEVENAVLVFGSAQYVTNTFQDSRYNGGFLKLDPIEASRSDIRMQNKVDAAGFSIGDYVAIYSATSGDVIPSETSRVTAVSPGDGILTLAHPLARSFDSPSIAGVTALATVDVGLKELVVQGARPLVVHEVFGFIAEGNDFISDTSAGDNNVYGLNMNTVRGFRFSRNTFESVGPTVTGIELPQRNSQDGLFENNTFRATWLGFGEYAAHWTFVRNQIRLFPDSTVGVALALGGLDVMFRENEVYGNGLTAGSGSGSIVADFLGPDSYSAFVGQINIRDNIFHCEAHGSCIRLVSKDVVFSENRVYGQGSTTGVAIPGLPDQAVRISHNEISVERGTGIVVNASGFDDTTIAGNTISATAGQVGINVVTPKTVNSGKHCIVNNNISGFLIPIKVDLSKHPGTQLSNCPSK